MVGAMAVMEGKADERLAPRETNIYAKGAQGPLCHFSLQSDQSQRVSLRNGGSASAPVEAF
jgi:hypothetical protein